MSVLLLFQTVTNYVQPLYETVPYSESRTVVARLVRAVSENVGAIGESIASTSTADALRFNAAADRLQIPGAGMPTVGGNWTVITWVRVAASSAGQQFIWSLDSTFSSSWHALIVDTVSNLLYLVNTGASVLSFGALTLNKWYYVAVWKDSSNNVKGYLGDESAGALTTFTNTISALANYNEGGFIGAYGGGSSPLDGRLSGFRLWDAALSDAEVDSEHFVRAPVRTTNLLDFYPFRKPTNPYEDLSGNSNTLTNPGGSGSWTLEAAPAWASGTAYSASLSETVTLSESIVARFNARPSLSETVSLSESLAVIRRTTQALSETVTLSESQLAKYNAKVTPSETVTLSESTLVKYNAKVTPSETVTLSEAVAVVRRTIQALSETVTLSESQLAKYNAKVTPAETVTLSEARVARYGARVTPSETVTLSEATLVKYNAKVFPSETVTLSESTLVKYNAKVTPAETVTLSESTLVKYNAKVFPSETVTLSESVNVITAGGGVSLSETVIVSELLTVMFNAKRTLTETVTLSESQLAKYNAKVTPAETVTLSESQLAKYNAKVTPAETVTLAELVAVSRKVTQALNETVTLSEARVARYGARVTPSETVTLSEAVVNRANWKNTLSETVTFSDVLVGRYNAKTTVSETVNLAESTVARKGILVGLSETVTLAETRSARYGAQLSLSETVSITEVLTLATVVDLNETVAWAESLSTLLTPKNVPQFAFPTIETARVAVNIVAPLPPGPAPKRPSVPYVRVLPLPKKR